jgi:hypothetical protein
LTIHDRGSGIIPSLYVPHLPKQLTIGDIQNYQIFFSRSDDGCSATQLDQGWGSIGRAIFSPLPLFFARTQVIGHDAPDLCDAQTIHDER